MTDDDFEDLETLPDDTDDGYVRIRKDDLKQVRRAARARGAAEKELSAYKRQDSVRKAGIDGLNERQIAALAREAEGDESPENLRKIAEELGFVQPADPALEREQQEIDTEIDQQAAAVAAVNGATPVNTRATVQATEVAEWPMDKLMRLDRDHPEIYELAMRGEPISLPAGFN